MDIIDLAVSNRSERREVRFGSVHIVVLEFQLEWVISKLRTDTTIGNILRAMDRKLSVLLAGAVDAYDVEDHDRVGIRVSIDGNTFYKLRQLKDNPLGGVLELIRSVLQSAFDLLFDRWSITITLIPSPRGAGRPHKVAWNEASLFNKKSVVKINNNDNLCLWRSVVVSLAYQNKQGKEGEEKKEADRFYKAIKRPSGRRQEHEARALLRNSQCDAPNSGGGTFDDLVKVADYLQRDITVFNMSVSRFVEFRTASLRADGGYGNVLYLLKLGDHFHAVTSVKGFLATNYYCDKCNVRYKTPGGHRCKGSDLCYYCRIPKSEHNRPYGSYHECPDCSRTFSDEQCFESHLQALCKVSWKCKLCWKCFPHTRTREEHQCGEEKCRTCGQWAVGEHLCFIQPKQAKGNLPNEKIKYFDFESDPGDKKSGDYHMVNLAVVSSDGDLDSMTVYENGGDNVIDMFVEGEFCLDNAGCTYVAHNAKGYDAHFIKECLSRKGYKFHIIPRGNKIMMLTIKTLNIRIIDSSCFIQYPLAKFPKMFGLNDKAKGTYPYLFNTKENWNYVGPIPPLHYFVTQNELNELEGVDVTKLNDKDNKEKLLLRLHKLVQWWTEFRDSNKTWNNLEQLIAYCKNDVMLLALGCTLFREHFIGATETDRWSEPKEDEKTDDEGDALMSAPQGVDPFSYPTIASACMATYRHKFLQKDTIAYIKRYRVPKLHSAVRWLSFLSFSQQTRIQHCRNSGEDLSVSGVPVTGFSEEGKRVYIYHDCEEDGCPQCHPKLEKAREKSQAQVETVKGAGYEVEEMWHCAFLKMWKKDPHCLHFQSLHPVIAAEPLCVRDAFFGGRTNASCLYYLCKDGEKIRYVDFTSLYPWVNKYGVYPVGHPQIRLDVTVQDIMFNRIFGVVKCKVLPPKGLFHPVLPLRHGGKLLFPLCLACVEESSWECSHTLAQRAFVGTWCTPEVQVAVQKGYQVLDVYEAHHFPKREVGLFSGYINTFFKLKQEASGWPNGCETPEQKQEFLAKFRAKEGISLDASSVEKNEGKRRTYKIGANSFWGKWAQRGNLTQSKICTNADEFWTVLLNENFEITNMFLNPNNLDVVEVLFEEEDCHWSEPLNTNIYIACFTTALARLKLYSVLDLLGMRVLYYDTDSVVYVEGNDCPQVELGSFLGDLTDELCEDCEDGSVWISEFVSTGPKSYSYRTSAGAVVCKVKGLRKTLNNLRVVNLKSMLECLNEARVHKVVHAGLAKPLSGAKNLTFKLDKYGNVQTEDVSKAFRMVYNKRLIWRDYLTVPFGYE